MSNQVNLDQPYMGKESLVSSPSAFPAFKRLARRQLTFCALLQVISIDAGEYLN